MLTNGNRKLGRKIWNFNLPTTTCLYKTDYCKEYCYAENGAFKFKHVIDSMKRNYDESLKDDFVEKIDNQIKKKRILMVRIHASGDFYSQDYINKWFEIALLNPNTKFLAYTRNVDANFKGKPPNFTLYFSKDSTTIKCNQTILNEATVIETVNLPHMTKVKEGFICNSKCKTCHACWYGKIPIVFPIHN